MGPRELLFITISHNVSFMGKTWWMLMLVFRLLVVLLAGFSVFSDEQDRFICNTLQPGCSNVCFDVFAPVSVLRLWLFHLVLLCLPHVLFATYVVHKLFSYVEWSSAFRSDQSRGGSPLFLKSSSSSGEQEPSREGGTPRFHCAYILAVILRILLEVAFGACHFFLVGLSVPKSFFCYEAPCSSGVECFVSRPTEKTLMLNFMLGVASLSVLLSLVDLGSSMKAMVRWRTNGEMLMEEMSKGEQSSMFTTTTLTEDSDVLVTRKLSPGGSSAGVRPNHEELLHAKVNCGSAQNNPENKDAKADASHSSAPMSSPAPAHFVLHSYLRPPLSPRPDKVPPKRPSQSTAAGPNHQANNSESQDKRAWV
ncbi:gap junction delta-4 protein-like [Echeneis naucrates]|uniref:gap junction delta-4 protein-like n=1 Tax=Echeneis naucrates TaxID=173247 RepID=UPI001113AACD|nr:gap junction delta-4 protein-like [Echeneis naucrates]